MALFVPALRLTMLFLNVYDSYKTLKPPPPSARDPTRPSLRATTQRKRDMKGCLAVWVVWCCFTSYERMVESLVSMFIPFYDEFKSMFILFLIFTRARGAEPIFLHLVRPIIKPYTSTLDGTLDVIRMVGDFLFALSMYPFHVARAWWHRRYNPQVDSDDSASETTTSSHQTTTENTTNSTAQHNVWIPPASAYNEEDNSNEDVDAPPEFVDLTPEERAVDEWRQYPAFPSAYPTSPLLTTSFFPPTTTSFAGVMKAHDGMPSYPPNGQFSDGEGFPRSLQSSRHTENPSYAGSSDRTRQPSGFMQASNTRSSTMNGPSQVYSDDEHHGDSMDEDDHHNNLFSGSEIGTDDEEDSFNMTLRTPLPPHGAARSRALMERLHIPLPLGRANSMNSQSTTIPSARTTASTFRTWSSRGSDPDSLEPSPTDRSALLSASSATLVADAGLGLMMGEDMAKTLVEPKQRRQQAAKKRKAVNGAGLQDLTETSDTVDDDEEDVEMDDEEEDGDEDGDDQEDGEGEDVFIPSEQQEVKRRKIVGKPGGAATTSLRPTQSLNGLRKPLSTRPSLGQIGSTGTSSASQQAAKTHTKSISAGKANTNTMAPKVGAASSASAAKRTGISATRPARGGVKPTTNTARTASSVTVKGKPGTGAAKKGTSSASSSTATLPAPQIGRTVSSGSNASNGSSSTGPTS